MSKTISFCLFLIIFYFHCSDAATYYFAITGGDDSRSSVQAQSSSTPWKTIGKLNTIMDSLNPGDQILFRRGDIFKGSIIATASGTVCEF